MDKWSQRATLARALRYASGELLRASELAEELHRGNLALELLEIAAHLGNVGLQLLQTPAQTPPDEEGPGRASQLPF